MSENSPRGTKKTGYATKCREMNPAKWLNAQKSPPTTPRVDYGNSLAKSDGKAARPVVTKKIIFCWALD